MRRLSEERPILWRVLLLGTVNLVFLAKQSVEEAVDVGLAGSLAVDAAVVEAIVVVEVGLVTTLVDDANSSSCSCRSDSSCRGWLGNNACGGCNSVDSRCAC